VAAPRRSVFICALPRTGSSLIAHLLWRSGAVGYPGEWFWREDAERNRAAWGTRTFPEYLERVLDEGTSSGGVFAAKVMWGYVHELLFELRRLAREYDADDLALLRRFLPEPRFVWLRRRDVVAQAVSWAKAVQTGQWAAGQPAGRAPEFDFEQIDALYHLARVHDGAWQRWFATHGTSRYGWSTKSSPLRPSASAARSSPPSGSRRCRTGAWRCRRSSGVRPTR